MAKASELRDQSVVELKALYSDLTKDIYQLRNEFKVTRKIEKPHQIKSKKRDRARIATILHEKGEPI